MISKINAEIEKLEQEKIAINNDEEQMKLIEEQVEAFRTKLINSMNEAKAEQLKGIEFKLSCLASWKAELEEEAKIESVEEIKEEETPVDIVPINNNEIN